MADHIRWSRRRVLETAGLAAGAVTLRTMLWPSRAEAAAAPAGYLLLCYFSGGWDQMLALDPRDATAPQFQQQQAYAAGGSGIYPAYDKLTDAGVKAQAKAMATYNPAAAKKMLTEAGFTYKGGNLIDPKGNAVSLDIHVISGWSDWVASNQIITKNLSDIGIGSKVALEPDWGSWQPNAMSTKFPTLLWQGGSQGSPYGYFYANMSQNAFIPAGQDGSPTGNWEHYADPSATSLLNQWKVTLDPKKQQTIATQLEKLWLNDLPIVPLFIGPRWSTYSTKYFHCWDTQKNFFGDPIFTTFPDNILSFTRICPGGQAGA